jgi:hypothetical protein
VSHGTRRARPVAAPAGARGSGVVWVVCSQAPPSHLRVPCSVQPRPFLRLHSTLRGSRVLNARWAGSMTSSARATGGVGGTRRACMPVLEGAPGPGRARSRADIAPRREAHSRRSRTGP